MQLNRSNYRGTKRLKMYQILANSGYVFRASKHLARSMFPVSLCAFNLPSF